MWGKDWRLISNITPIRRNSEDRWDKRQKCSNCKGKKTGSSAQTDNSKWSHKNGPNVASDSSCDYCNPSIRNSGIVSYTWQGDNASNDCVSLAAGKIWLDFAHAKGHPQGRGFTKRSQKSTSNSSLEAQPLFYILCICLTRKIINNSSHATAGTILTFLNSPSHSAHGYISLNGRCCVLWNPNWRRGR